jgi:hypothetical protein
VLKTHEQKQVVPAGMNAFMILLSLLVKPCPIFLKACGRTHPIVIPLEQAVSKGPWNTSLVPIHQAPHLQTSGCDSEIRDFRLIGTTTTGLSQAFHPKDEPWRQIDVLGSFWGSTSGHTAGLGTPKFQGMDMWVHRALTGYVLYARSIQGTFNPSALPQQ